MVFVSGCNRHAQVENVFTRRKSTSFSHHKSNPRKVNVLPGNDGLLHIMKKSFPLFQFDTWESLEYNP